MRTKILMGICMLFGICSMWSYSAFAEYYVVASSPCFHCYHHRSPCHHYYHHYRYHRVYHYSYKIEKYYPCTTNNVWVPRHCDCYGRCVGGYLQSGYIGGGQVYAEPDQYDDPNYYRSEAIDRQFDQDMATGDDYALRCPDMNCQY
jgi:hypothetical protein